MSSVLRIIRASVPCKTSGFSFIGSPTFRFPTGIMACFLLESDRTFCAIFRRQAQICQETAGRLLIEDGVVVITNEMSAFRLEFLDQDVLTSPDIVNFNMGRSLILFLAVIPLTGVTRGFPQTHESSAQE